MTSKIQQLLDTFMDYNMEEQQKCLEIVDNKNDIVKDESQGNKKNQQAGASNSNKQETPTTIQRIPEIWEDPWKDELPKEKRMENTAITQIVSQESEDQGSQNDLIKLKEVETSSKSREKRGNIQCYNCTKRGHIMKDCPFSPKIIKRKNNTHSTFLYL